MRLATWLGALSVGAGGGVEGASWGARARSSVAPARVLPTAKAGPSPPSDVDSRLRPTTRGGGVRVGSGAGVLGGGALATRGGVTTGFSGGGGGGGGGG